MKAKIKVAIIFAVLLILIVSTAGCSVIDTLAHTIPSAMPAGGMPKMQIAMNQNPTGIVDPNAAVAQANTHPTPTINVSANATTNPTPVSTYHLTYV